MVRACRWEATTRVALGLPAAAVVLLFALTGCGAGSSSSGAGSTKSVTATPTAPATSSSANTAPTEVRPLPYTGCIIVVSGNKLCGQDAVDYCTGFGGQSTACSVVLETAYPPTQADTNFNQFQDRVKAPYSKRLDQCHASDPNDSKAECQAIDDVISCIDGSDTQRAVRYCQTHGPRHIERAKCQDRSLSDPSADPNQCGFVGDTLEPPSG
jgi:hypothetical protein